MSRFLYQSLGEYDTRNDRFKKLLNDLLSCNNDTDIIKRAVYTFENTGDHTPLTQNEIDIIAYQTGITLTRNK